MKYYIVMITVPKYMFQAVANNSKSIILKCTKPVGRWYSPRTVHACFYLYRVSHCKYYNMKGFVLQNIWDEISM